MIISSQESIQARETQKYYLKPSYHHKLYDGEKCFNCLGWSSIDVLQFLWGKPWNEIALGYVHSLRPSAVYVSTGMFTCDTCTWRVKVLIDKDNIIENISQEVEVGLPDGIHYGGYGLDQAMKDQ